jgi:hypothetical protein
MIAPHHPGPETQTTETQATEPGALAVRSMEKAALLLAGGSSASHRVPRRHVSAEQLQKNAHLFTRVAHQRMLDINVLLRTAQDQETANTHNVEIVCSGTHQEDRRRMLEKFRFVPIENGIGGRLSTLPTPLSTWPQRTEVPCWNCEETFETPPLTLPLCLEPKFGVFRVEGIFCNFRCALRFAHDRYFRSPLFSDIVNMAKNVAHIYFGIPMDTLYAVQPAPDPKKTLRKYNPVSGLSIEEYRDPDLCARSAPLHDPPFLSYAAVLEANSQRYQELKQQGAEKRARTQINPTTQSIVVHVGEDVALSDSALSNLRRPSEAPMPLPAVPVSNEQTQRLRDAVSTVHKMSSNDLSMLTPGVRRIVCADIKKGYGSCYFDEKMSQAEQGDTAVGTLRIPLHGEPHESPPASAPAKATKTAKTAKTMKTTITAITATNASRPNALAAADLVGSSAAVAATDLRVSSADSVSLVEPTAAAPDTCSDPKPARQTAAAVAAVASKGAKGSSKAGTATKGASSKLTTPKASTALAPAMAPALEPVLAPALEPVPAPALEPVPAPALEPVPAPAIMEPVPAPAIMEPVPVPAIMEPVPVPAIMEPVLVPALAPALEPTLGMIGGTEAVQYTAAPETAAPTTTKPVTKRAAKKRPAPLVSDGV